MDWIPPAPVGMMRISSKPEVTLGAELYKGGVVVGCAPFSWAATVDSAGAEGYLGSTQSAPEGLAHEDAE